MSKRVWLSIGVLFYLPFIRLCVFWFFSRSIGKVRLWDYFLVSLSPGSVLVFGTWLPLGVKGMNSCATVLPGSHELPPRQISLEASVLALILIPVTIYNAVYLDHSQLFGVCYISSPQEIFFFLLFWPYNLVQMRMVLYDWTVVFNRSQRKWC